MFTPRRSMGARNIGSRRRKPRNESPTLVVPDFLAAPNRREQAVPQAGKPFSQPRLQSGAPGNRALKAERARASGSRVRTRGRARLSVGLRRLGLSETPRS